MLSLSAFAVMLALVTGIFSADASDGRLPFIVGVTMPCQEVCPGQYDKTLTRSGICQCRQCPSGSAPEDCGPEKTVSLEECRLTHHCEEDEILVKAWGTCGCVSMSTFCELAPDDPSCSAEQDDGDNADSEDMSDL